MEQEKERDWCLVRNNNGEWISDEHAVFMIESLSKVYKSQAKQFNLPLSPQTCHEKRIWYYEHEIEAIDEAYRKKTNNTLIKDYHNL